MTPDETTQTNPRKAAGRLVLALSVASFLGLAACSTTSTNSSGTGTASNDGSIRRAERLADQLPRGGG